MAYQFPSEDPSISTSVLEAGDRVNVVTQALEQVLALAQTTSCRAAGEWLAHWLYKAGLSEEEATIYMRMYQLNLPKLPAGEVPYTLDAALDDLAQLYARDTLEGWQ